MKTKRRDVDETKLNIDDQSGAPCIHECSAIHGNVALGDGKPGAFVGSDGGCGNVSERQKEIQEARAMISNSNDRNNPLPRR
jgi:hypothetical protein